MWSMGRGKEQFFGFEKVSDQNLGQSVTRMIGTKHLLSHHYLTLILQAVMTGKNPMLDWVISDFTVGGDWLTFCVFHIKMCYVLICHHNNFLKKTLPRSLTLFHSYPHSITSACDDSCALKINNKYSKIYRYVFFAKKSNIYLVIRIYNVFLILGNDILLTFPWYPNL